jgi:hypothetical protein
MWWMRLREIVLEKKLLSRERLSQVLRYQRENGGFLGSLLVDLGLLPEVTVVRLLATQFGVEGVCLSNRAAGEGALCSYGVFLTPTSSSSPAIATCVSTGSIGHPTITSSTAAT